MAGPQSARSHLAFFPCSYSAHFRLFACIPASSSHLRSRSSRFSRIIPLGPLRFPAFPLSPDPLHFLASLLIPGTGPLSRPFRHLSSFQTLASTCSSAAFLPSVPIPLSSHLPLRLQLRRSEGVVPTQKRQRNLACKERLTMRIEVFRGSLDVP